MEKVIEIANLTKEYKEKKAVDDLSFDVYEGEILGLLGPNGSGKSTTINSILALIKYQSGTIKIFGQEMKPDSYDIKEKIGVIFQDVAVFDELSVYDNINYFCGLSCLRATLVSPHRNRTIRFIIVFSSSIFPVNFLCCQPDCWALLPLYPRIKLK